MSLSIDGNQIDSTPVSSLELKNRLSALQVKLDAVGRILRSITIGEQTYWDVNTIPDPGQQDVYVQTCSYNEYVDEAAADLNVFSERLIGHLEGCVTSWSSGHEQEALVAFSEATQGIDWVIQTGSQIYQFRNSEAELTKWAPFERLQHQVQAMVSLLERNDSVEMADAVRYELVPAIQDFVENATSL